MQVMGSTMCHERKVSRLRLCRPHAEERYCVGRWYSIAQSHLCGIFILISAQSIQCSNPYCRVTRRYPYRSSHAWLCVAGGRGHHHKHMRRRSTNVE